MPDRGNRHKGGLMLPPAERERFAAFPPSAQALLARHYNRQQARYTQHRQRVAEFLRRLEAELVPPDEREAFRSEARAITVRGRLKLSDALGCLLLIKMMERENAPRQRLARLLAGSE
jgi:hypothetical protein